MAIKLPPLTKQELRLLEVHREFPEMGAGSRTPTPRSKKIAELLARQQAIEEEANRPVTPLSIMRRVAERFFAPEASSSEVARLGKLLAEMTKGALVPVTVQHTGMSLEAFLEASQGSAEPTPALDNHEVKPEPVLSKPVLQ